MRMNSNSYRPRSWSEPFPDGPLMLIRSIVKYDKIQTDNCVFKLHYTFTVLVLVVFSILLTSKQYFGEPIDCTAPDDKKTLIDTYCWIFGTYLVKDSMNDDILPGMGVETGKEVMWHKYYQWISLIFFIQAVAFYIPRYFWKAWEGGRIKLLVQDLDSPLITQTWTVTNKLKLVNYLLGNRYVHNLYAAKYTACEILNLLNVLTQILLMDLLLTGHFSLYGPTVVSTDARRYMNRVFPKVTKCTFHTYGPSGSKVKLDSLCVLPLNIVNEKLFVILWFWFVILASVSLLDVLYRFFLMLCPKARVLLLKGQLRYNNDRLVEVVVREISYGDFFVLYYVGKNLNPVVYRELVKGVHDGLTRRVGGDKLGRECEV